MTLPHVQCLSVLAMVNQQHVTRVHTGVRRCSPAVSGQGLVQQSLTAVPSAMLRRKITHTDLEVSPCCLGGMTWGSQNTEVDASEQLSLAFDLGVNFIDTAEGYPVPMAADTQGLTDLAIAKWMKTSRQPRNQVVISTKVCGYNDRYTWLRESGEGTRLTRAQIIESVEGSLRRLGVDEIDLLQLHWPDRQVNLTNHRAQRISGTPGQERARGVVPYEEQVEAMDQLVREGKVRYWGLSNENADGVLAFREAASQLAICPPVVVQNAYSLLQRYDEHELIPKSLEAGVQKPCRPEIAYIAYSPLSAGVLSGKYAYAEAAEKAPRKSTKKRSRRLGLIKGYTDSFLQTQAPAAVSAYVQCARKHGVTPSQFAIAHCNSRRFICSTIVGATSMSQLAENLVGFSVQWSQQMEDDVLEIYRKYPDPWRVQVAGGG